MAKQEDVSKLLTVMSQLREKCPWDQKQTHQTLLSHLIEETYELVDAIESANDEHILEELGDLLFQVVFHSHLAEERGQFNFYDVVSQQKDKLIERHPHVFDTSSEQCASQVQANWEQNKQAIKARDSILDDVPLAMPALARAQKIQKRAASVGFDWQQLSDIQLKLTEELQEFSEAVATESQASIAEELGDILFTVVNLARYLNFDSEEMLRSATKKFEKRFRYIENTLTSNNQSLVTTSFNEMEALWQQAKKQ